MQSPPMRGLPAVLILAVLLGAGCASAGGPRLQSQPAVTTASDRTTTSGVAEPPPTTQEPNSTVAAAATASPEAERFIELTSTLSGLGDGVAGFSERVDPVRIDKLATIACASVDEDMSDTQLGLAGLAIYEDLTEQEREQIDQEDWVVFYGTLLGYFCPEKLPNIDLEAAPPTEGTTVEQFRATVSQIDGVSAEAAAFVGGLSDERLGELQTLACRGDGGEITMEEFGLSIISAYGEDLSDAERGAISVSAFGELYGAFIGWFCPANLPL